MQIFPAIDLRGGKVVRLTQGDYDRMTGEARKRARQRSWSQPWDTTLGILGF